MRQPVSRISFDRRRGFLGIHLQEGAPFVDAVWNEGSDLTWSLLRDAIIAGGVEGTSGRELRIEPIEDAEEPGRLCNLKVCGTSANGAAPRPFYCNGLPVLWPQDCAIDRQPIGDGFRIEATGHAAVPDGGTWIDLLPPQTYEIFLRARVATFDRLDEPFLDDPGLDAPRGTFRKQVIGDVRIRKAGATPPPAGTNLRLSVDGSYVSDLNALYRVELDAVTGWPDAPVASILWDPDAAATVARVIDTAAEGARRVVVDTTEGFESGFVRFEGQGVGPELYRVTKAPKQEGTAIQVTRHRCDRSEVSLASWHHLGRSQPLAGKDGSFSAIFVMPRPLQKGDLISCLPIALEVPWPEAQVAEVEAFDPVRNTVTLALRQAPLGVGSPRALSQAGWKADRPAVRKVDQTFTAVLVAPPAIASGDVVTALPESLGTPATPMNGPWVVLSVAPVTAAELEATGAATLPPSAGAPVTITFGPAGLAQPLLALESQSCAKLQRPCRAFDTTLEVDVRDDWRVGARISILPASQDASNPTAREDRTIVRIERTTGKRAAGHRRGAEQPTMLVRLDLPLSFDHAAGDEVVPQRLIRVRRFAGHDCRRGIEVVDPARIDNFQPGLPLPGGISIHLTMEQAEAQPRFERGDGWHFAARSDGWVETRMFAPVEEEPASEVPLAWLTVTDEGYELVDVRPLPAARSADVELGQIEGAASTIAALLGEGPVTDLLQDVVRLSSYPRVQLGLVPRIHELTGALCATLLEHPVCWPWLERLQRAASEIEVGQDPTRRQLAAIAFALGGCAFALSTTPAPPPAAPAPPDPDIELEPPAQPDPDYP